MNDVLMKDVLDILSELNNIWNNYIVNYPKKYYELVKRIKEELFNLVKYIILKDKKRINISICMLDFFLEVSYEKRIISEKKCIELGNKLYLINYKAKELFL